MDNDKIEIQLDEHTKLVAWKDAVSELNEMCIYLERDGYICQDLVLVRQKFEQTDEGTKNIPGKFEAFVWGDATQEDYTDEFEIDEYIEKENTN